MGLITRLPLSETCTYAIEESEDVDRTFCYDLPESVTSDSINVFKTLQQQGFQR